MNRGVLVWPLLISCVYVAGDLAFHLAGLPSLIGDRLHDRSAIALAVIQACFILGGVVILKLLRRALAPMRQSRVLILAACLAVGAMASFNLVFLVCIAAIVFGRS
jgi:Na+-translocating ferredoxin:NAD+ oxidoreductase RnfD subunit